MDKENLISPRDFFVCQFGDIRSARNRSLVRCCFHPDRNPSLSLNLETGAFKCFSCGAHGGDIIAFYRLLHNASFFDALRALAPGIALSSRSLPEPRKSEDSFDAPAQRRIDALWRKSSPISRGTPPWLYLNRARSLPLKAVPGDLRWHPDLPYYLSREDGSVAELGRFPALLGAVRNGRGDLVNVQRIYLTQEGLKAPVPEPKKLMPSPRAGILQGCAIRLFPPDDILGVAEGIETALACHASTEMPVWASVTAGGMETLILPEGLKELVVFADHDLSGRGAQAAERLAGRATASGVIAKVLMPSQAGTDWADTFTKRNGDIHEYKPIGSPERTSRCTSESVRYDECARER